MLFRSASIVQRVMERRSRGDDAIDDRRGHTDLLTNCRAHHARGMGPMEIEHVPDAGVDGRDGNRPALGLEGEVAYQRLIEDAVDCRSVIRAPLWQAVDRRSFRW